MSSRGWSVPEMPDVIRAFIALELPGQIRQELARISQALADKAPPRAVRWVKPDKMHLTLRFLGDTAVAQIPAINQALDEWTREQAPFSLHLDRLGCFPNRKRPRVIWVGLQGNEAELFAFKRGIDALLLPFGWEVENKKFQAHLTLGRVKDGRQLANLPWDMQVEPLTFLVTAVALIESRLTSQGPIYTIRHQAALG